MSLLLSLASDLCCTRLHGFRSLPPSSSRPRLTTIASLCSLKSGLDTTLRAVGRAPMPFSHPPTMHSSSPSKPSVTRLSDEEVALLDETSLASSDMESDNDPSRPHELANYFQLQEAPSRLKSCAVTWMTASLDALRLMPIRHLLVRVALFLVPSFLQGRHAREQFLRPSHKLAPTAYLDGIRGLAALFVFFCHYSYQAFTIAKSWGTDQDNRAFLKLPFVRIWYQGPAAVCVFFVISGYALSYKPLKLIRSQNTLDFSTTVSSLTFRRAIRLYLPTATSTFLIACLLQLGLYELTREFATDRTYMKHVMEPHPEMMESAYAQFRDWAWKMFEFVCVFDWGIYSGQPCKDRATCRPARDFWAPYVGRRR